MSWKTDNLPLFVCGKTRSGKTYYVQNRIHKSSDKISIWLNEIGENRVKGISGTRVRSLEGLVKGLKRGDTTFNWLSRDRTRDLQIIQQFIWRKAEQFNRKVEFQLCVDECHRLLPETRSNSNKAVNCGELLAKEGSKRGLSLVLMSQAPQDVKKSILREREWLLCFELTYESRDYMRKFVQNPDAIMNQRQYSAVLYDATGSIVEEDVRA